MKRSVLWALGLLACGCGNGDDGAETPSSGGDGNASGGKESAVGGRHSTATGGTSNGGSATGGTVSSEDGGGTTDAGANGEGAAAGQTQSGGVTSGGAPAGGVAVGGSSTGGTDGAHTGGRASGGNETGGETGGGGIETGGSATGGSVTGGSATGGNASGGAATGGSAPGDWWRPTAEAPVHWHWQLSQDFEFPRDVLPNKTIYDLDGELTSAETVAALHALGPDVKVICYFDAGVYEDYRSDADSFPESIIGNADIGWEGSYWLDIRQLDVLMPILRNRAEHWCKDKGFDAVEPDETEVWSNDPGFPITKEENNAFNRAVADMVHELGLSVGLKGNNTEAPELVDHFDWALTEQCWEYEECDIFRDSFVAQNKLVLNVEYDAEPDCERANRWHINSSRRDLDLVGPTARDYLYEPCIPDDQDTW